MKKINNILTNYFSLNLLSMLGNLSLFIVLFYLYILYPIATYQLPKEIDSFDVLYGMVMEIFNIYKNIEFIFHFLLICALIEFIIKRFSKYQTFSLVKNKIYITFFYLGLLVSVILIIIYVI